MQEESIKFLLNFTLQHSQNLFPASTPPDSTLEECPLSSKEVLEHIFEILICPENHRDARKHKKSLSCSSTNEQPQTKCSCKKSKCLKLYCECFAKGLFCQDCNCDCCHNSQHFAEERAKAIDEMLMRTSLNLGSKKSSMKGCNCKKTGCVKKYCECFNSGAKCSEYCKCINCENGQ